MSIKKILFLTFTNNKLTNGNILCEIQRLKSLTEYGEISYLSLTSNKKESKFFIKKNNLSSINIIEPNFFWIVRLAFRLNYMFNVIFCNKLKIYNNHYFVKINLFKSLFDKYDIIFSFYIFPALTLGLFKNKSSKFSLIIDTNDVLTNRHKLLGSRNWFSVSQKDEFLMSNKNVLVATISKNDESHYSNILGKKIYKLYFNNICENSILDKIPHNPHFKNKIGILSSNSPLNRRDLNDILSVMNLHKNEFIPILKKIKIGGSITNYAKTITDDQKIIFHEEKDYLNEFYKDLKILLVPNGKSSGIKTKILESLNYGVTVITTQYGYDDSLNIFRDYIIVINHPIEGRKLKEAIDLFLNKEMKDFEFLQLKSKLNAYDSLIQTQFYELITSACPK